MKRTLFKRLLGTYLTIFTVAILTLSFALTLAYRGYAFDEKRRTLENAAYEVNQSLNLWTGGKITQEELNRTLDSAGYMTDSKIYVVRIDSEIFGKPGSEELFNHLDDRYLIDDLEDILEGDKVFRRSQYSEKLDMRVVFSGAPWQGEDGVVGAILLFSPVNEINLNVAKINLVIWGASAAFILAGGFIIFFTSRKISKPVREMEMAAGRLAAGDAAEDIQTDTDDEVGQLASTFNFMKRQLVETEEMRRSFIASVSHDIRTPLTSINGFVEGMMDGVIKIDDYPRCLAIIKNETERLNRLTKDILRTAKIESGRLEIFKQELNCRDIEDCLNEGLKALAEEKSIGLTLECEEGLAVHADKEKLGQIIDNIVGNAIKYSGKGCDVRIGVVSGPYGVEFRVTDTGMGISEEELPRIFDKFYRADKSRSSENGGSGLGLNIAKSLVEIHGGSIRAYSVLGKGTEIVFVLP